MMPPKLQFILNIILLLFTAVSVYYLISYWDVEDEIVKHEILNVMEVGISFTPHAEITSPTVLYGNRDHIYGNDLFFMNMIKRFWLEYKITRSENLTGYYSIKTYLSPSESRSLPKWRVELPYSFEGSIEEDNTGKLFIDIFAVKDLWDKVNRETGIAYNTPIIEVEIRFDIISINSNSKIKKELMHTAKISLNKIIGFENLNYVKRENIEKEVKMENYISTPAGNITPSALRILLSIILLASLSTMTFLNRSRILGRFYSREKNDQLSKIITKKYKIPVIKTRKIPITGVNAVFLDRIEDLGTIAYELDMPVLETPEYFAVLYNGNAYVYTRGKSDEKKK